MRAASQGPCTKRARQKTRSPAGDLSPAVRASQCLLSSGVRCISRLTARLRVRAQLLDLRRHLLVLVLRAAGGALRPDAGSAPKARNAVSARATCWCVCPRCSSTSAASDLFLTCFCSPGRTSNASIRSVQSICASKKVRHLPRPVRRVDNGIVGREPHPAATDEVGVAVDLQRFLRVRSVPDLLEDLRRGRSSPRHSLSAFPPPAGLGKPGLSPGACGWRASAAWK